MQITLNQDEILTAVENYVRSQINIADNQRIEIDLRAGRGENGFTATLDIVPADLIREDAPADKPSAKPEVIKTGQVKEELAKAFKSPTKIFGGDKDKAEVGDESGEAGPEAEDEADESSEDESGEAGEVSEETLAKAPRSIFSKAAPKATLNPKSDPTTFLKIGPGSNSQIMDLELREAAELGEISSSAQVTPGSNAPGERLDTHSKIPNGGIVTSNGVSKIPNFSNAEKSPVMGDQTSQDARADTPDPKPEAKTSSPQSIFSREQAR